MTMQPNVQDDKQAQILDKLNQLKAKLKTTEHIKKDKQQLITLLNAEYQKLTTCRLEQLNIFEDQWNGYLTNQRQSRRTDAQRRREEMERLQQSEQSITKEKPRMATKIEMYNRILVFLDDANMIQILNDDDDDKFSTTMDTSVVVMPTDILDLFWSLDIPVPAVKSEIPLTKQVIQQRKEMAFSSSLP
ncbi:MAG: hypothetical protein EXX96DRAFT_614035 [Benjaminiella poitrasii]|nr:MAG: hypothetical protein EXX96DRAFT_614035 [Benjaminiella poitrasii]